MPENLKICIIGAGRMAYWHLKGYQNLKGVDVVGIAGKTPAHAERLKKKFSIPHAFTDYREMLEKLRPDAVNVVTPTYTHCPIVVDSFMAGCHVLCEKPMAMSLEEADRMMQAERESGTILMLGFSQRFYKEFMHMKEIIDRGKLGKIKVAWFRRGIGMPPQPWYAEPGKSLGVTCELAIHAIDWLRWIMNSEVIQVAAELTEHVRYPGIDDNMWMLLKFENGALGIVGASYTFPFLKRDIGIIGENMALTVERSKVIAEAYSDYSLARLVLKFIRYSLIIPYWLYYNPFQKELEHFIACIRKGTPPCTSSEDGKVSLAIALKALESARSGRKIHFDRNH